MRYSLYGFIKNIFHKIVPTYGINQIFLDEGILTSYEVNKLENIHQNTTISESKAHVTLGIQLADLVAAFAGVRLREAISKQPKMLSYGEKYGYEPAITANLGFELWASLRYGMLSSGSPKGDEPPEMTMFDTEGSVFFLEPTCPDPLAEQAVRLFSTNYIGCIH